MYIFLQIFHHIKVCDLHKVRPPFAYHITPNATISAIKTSEFILYHSHAVSTKQDSANAYFVQKYLNPLIKNVHFPYQKLTPAISWQNSILQKLGQLYEENKKELRPFITLKKQFIFSVCFLKETHH